MNTVELRLPDTFVFWDGHSHEGDPLQGRTIIQHVRSLTIIEVLDEELGVYVKEGVKSVSVRFTNRMGLKENIVLAVDFSHAEFAALDEVLSKAKNWYLKYCAWEDKNILDD